MVLISPLVGFSLPVLSVAEFVRCQPRHIAPWDFTFLTKVTVLTFQYRVQYIVGCVPVAALPKIHSRRRFMPPSDSQRSYKGYSIQCLIGNPAKLLNNFIVTIKIWQFLLIQNIKLTLTYNFEYLEDNNVMFLNRHYWWLPLGVQGGFDSAGRLNLARRRHSVCVDTRPLQWQKYAWGSL